MGISSVVDNGANRTNINGATPVGQKPLAAQEIPIDNVGDIINLVTYFLVASASTGLAGVVSYGIRTGFRSPIRNDICDNQRTSLINTLKTTGVMAGKTAALFYLAIKMGTRERKSVAEAALNLIVGGLIASYGFDNKDRMLRSGKIFFHELKKYSEMCYPPVTETETDTQRVMLPELAALSSAQAVHQMRKMDSGAAESDGIGNAILTLPIGLAMGAYKITTAAVSEVGAALGSSEASTIGIPAFGF